jgi:hypothetical protein
VTIRTRLTVTLGVLAAVVIALSALILDLASISTDLSNAPKTQMTSLTHVHELFDSSAQAAKDLLEVASGQDDAEEVEHHMELARASLAFTIHESARDPMMTVMIGEIIGLFNDLEIGQRRVLELVAVKDFKLATEAAIPLAEDLYEDDLRPLMGRLQHRSLVLAEDMRVAGEARASAAARRAIGLVIIGILGLVAGTVIVVRIRRRLTRLATTVGTMSSDIHGARSDDSEFDELGDLGRSFNRMADDVAKLVDATAAKEALASELALAARVQQMLLPPTPHVPGLEITGAMSAVTQVGGDHYDVLPTRDGAWISIGDVSGHGFNTGVIAMLAQSAITSVIRTSPTARPAEVLSIVNDVLNNLVHDRLHLRDHMALTLLRYHDDGTIEFAGAHQEILIRAVDGSLRTIETTGPWLAMMPDIGPHLVESSFTLAEGETMVLFTDGIVEARVGDDDMFGLPRLLDAIRNTPQDASVEFVRDAVFARVSSLSPTLDDDATVLVIRRSAAIRQQRAA